MGHLTVGGWVSCSPALKSAELGDVHTIVDLDFRSQGRDEVVLPVVIPWDGRREGVRDRRVRERWRS